MRQLKSIPLSTLWQIIIVGILASGLYILFTQGRFFFGLAFLLLTALLFFHNINIASLSVWSIISGFFWTVNVLAFNFAIKKPESLLPRLFL